jgi:hypothetical protein
MSAYIITAVCVRNVFILRISMGGALGVQIAQWSLLPLKRREEARAGEKWKTRFCPASNPTHRLTDQSEKAPLKVFFIVRDINN